MRLFVNGRKHTFKLLKKHIASTDNTCWFHCASLGEFEQGLPIMQAIKQRFPSRKILVTFFSPSGYEIKKNTPIADVVVYLPIDTPRNAKKFVALARPALAMFVKYEFWPNFLFQLKKQEVPTLLISGLFREEQLFFKSYGNFMHRALNSFDHIFVQNSASEALLKNSNIHHVSVSGDTRFDRVAHQIEQDNSLDFMETFKGDSLCVVCGSTWPEDTRILLSFINSAPPDLKFVIAPHKIDATNIVSFQKKLKNPSMRYSEGIKSEVQLRDSSVLIVDTIGYLTKMYSYADVAYIGGAMGSTGLHNILEAATFGVPIVIGKHFNEFPEAKRLQSLAGLYSVGTTAECYDILTKLTTDSAFRNTTGMIAGHFVNSNTGATQAIMSYVTKNVTS